jgi:hypothetical protein
LVEKAMGWRESYVAAWIATLLNNFVLPKKLGLVLGSDGMFRRVPERLNLPRVVVVEGLG